MTEVSFYTHAPDKLAVACKLAAKSLAQKLHVLIYAPDQPVAEKLDRLLWTQSSLSFLPHCRDTDKLAKETPIHIGTSADRLGSPDILINLSQETPPQFSRFSRLLEILGTDEPDLESGRQRYRFYKDRGYQLTSHNLQNGGNT